MTYKFHSPIKIKPLPSLFYSEVQHRWRSFFKRSLDTKHLITTNVHHTCIIHHDRTALLAQCSRLCRVNADCVWKDKEEFFLLVIEVDGKIVLSQKVHSKNIDSFTSLILRGITLDFLRVHMNITPIAQLILRCTAQSGNFGSSVVSDKF